MSQVFIVTPFGLQKGIDFSRVEKELIQPAIRQIGFNGGTTGTIIEQGNIRIDMFQLLLVADLVIADVSIHNANAFYELGARHAFREKRTFLIRCGKNSLPPDAMLDKVPFDLSTDRYFEYDYGDLSGSLPKLIAALKDTLRSEKRDSPIFQLLPQLKEYDHEVFLAVPLDFSEEVERLAAAGHAGDLSLLAAEAESFPWAITGLRLIGDALFKMKQWPLCRDVLERIRQKSPLDVDANLWLGTVYHRMGDLLRSEQALRNALNSPRLDQARRAEALALRGRNTKQLWQDAWSTAAPGEPQRIAALRSKYLKDSFQAYVEGFEEDQNSSYAGLNALAMLTIMIELATAFPETWAESFDTDAEALADLAEVKQARQHLTGAVECSITAAQKRVKRLGQSDPWLDASLADLRCLTSGRPRQVASAYRDAIAGLGAFRQDSVRRQLLLYRQLDILPANVNAALDLPDWTIPAAASPVEAKPVHVIVFTGHMIDAPGRPEPRFPAAKEEIARSRIREELLARLDQIPGCAPLGLSGGASGGDILFHEVCADLGIPTLLFLALPPDLFCKASVENAGPPWMKRYYELVKSHPPRVLAQSEDLPAWLQARHDYDLWQRNNLWMLHNAIGIAGKNLTLLALWDGKGGDKPGGTEDMVKQVEKLHARSVIIDTTKAFG